jgi:hypothetical protein
MTMALCERFDTFKQELADQDTNESADNDVINAATKSMNRYKSGIMELVNDNLNQIEGETRCVDGEGIYGL